MMKKVKWLTLIAAIIIALICIAGCGMDSSSLGASANIPDASADTIAEEGADEMEAAYNEEDVDDIEDDYDVEDLEEITEDEKVADDEEKLSDERTITVVLNTNKNRKRIHIPDTRCANQIHEENYLEWTGTAEELIDYAKKNGYVACGMCHPDVELNIELPKNK